MKGISKVLCGATIMSVMPVIAGAVGTYYNGNLYQNPQSRYGAMTGNGGGFYNDYGAGRGYGQGMQMRKTTVQTMKKTSSKSTSSAKKQGLHLDAYASHEFANWDFSLKNAGSKLHYDNLRWNSVNGEAAYYFGGSTPMQIKVGAKYGMQYGESPMVDDDVTSEAMWVVEPMEVDGNVEYVTSGTPALSAGTSKGGSMMEFNAAFGLTDLFSLGRVKVTPSIGYRYLKYKLETKGNYGLMVEVVHSDSLVNCLVVNAGEIQCSPYIGFADNNGDLQSIAGFSENSEGDLIILNDQSATQIDPGKTYYYEQAGTSHKYEAEWAGPYIALDMEYAINENNLVNMGVEFGLPIYDSKGDQPYRFDWAHPTSVEDKGDFGDAYHLGLNAVWSTALSESVMLSLGMTYDYYRVNNATAKTYLNPTLYQASLENAEDWIDYFESLGTLDDNQLALLEAWKDEYNRLDSYKSRGWTMESKNEIESVYKAMGIRLGVNVKF